jgi:glutamine synthetase
MLAAGLDGMCRQLEPPSPTESNLYETKSAISSLPSSLHEAILSLGSSPVMRDVLGDSTVDYLVRKRKEEWSEYVAKTGNPGNSEITDWEIERYLLSN